MARRDAPAPVLDAVQHLDALVQAGVIPAEVEVASGGWVEVRLWARNLVEPYSKRISIRVKETNADVQKLMASTLP